VSESTDQPKLLGSTRKVSWGSSRTIANLSLRGNIGTGTSYRSSQHRPKTSPKTDSCQRRQVDQCLSSVDINTSQSNGRLRAWVVERAGTQPKPIFEMKGLSPKTLKGTRLWSEATICISDFFGLTKPQDSCHKSGGSASRQPISMSGC